MASVEYPLKGWQADFIRVGNGGWDRYIEICSDSLENRIDALDTGTPADFYLSTSRDCYVLGLYELTTFLCGRSLEEVLAWIYYKELKASFGKDKATKIIKNKDLSCLIKWAQGKGLLSKQVEEQRIVDAIKWVRNLNAHARIIMMMKVQERLDSGNRVSEALSEVMPKEVDYPDWFVEIAKAGGFTPDAKKPVVGWLVMKDATLKILKATVKIIEELMNCYKRA